MRPALSRSWLAIAGVAILQTAALSWMVYDRISLLRDGREIVAKVIPVDPRDLFRGDYVILGYSFTRAGDLTVPKDTRQGDRVYVTLKPVADDEWEVSALSPDYPQTVDPANVVISGRVTNVYKQGETGEIRASLRYGIESYFVPEGTGRPLEEKVGEKKIAAVIAVGSKGQAAIKALMIDGQRIATEPLL